jgi:hypothetical protein
MKPRAGVSRKSHVRARSKQDATLRAAQAIPRDRTTGRQSRDAKSCNSHVWLDARHLKIKSKSQKLNPKRLGPFKVLDRVGNLDYRIELLLQPKRPDRSPDMPISRAQERSRTNSEVRSPTQKCEKIPRQGRGLYRSIYTGTLRLDTASCPLVL